MDKIKLIKGRVLPLTVVCSALVFSPYGGLEARAGVQVTQQINNIKGVVVDDHGDPVIGATVIVVGSKGQGAVTDMDGNFSLSVKPGTKLKITYIGYDDQVVTARNSMKVQLKSGSAVNLNGVEIVAYGVQKKVTVTGALSSVKGKDLIRTPVGSVNNVLAGQLSGVTTVQYSGEPGSDAATVFVRGRGTTNNSEPLIEVDGVERSMSDIDPNDIESITVLKDASATAVFGVRGANGVILITTKRGKEGKAQISASTSYSILTPTKMVEQASSLGYAEFYNQMCDNDGVSHMFSDAVIQKFRDGSDPIRFPSTKWDDYVMKKSTQQTKTNVSISGGTKKLRYFISAGMYTQGGLFKEFGQDYHFGYQYHRFNYRANIDMDLTSTTTLSVNIAGNTNTSYKPHTGQGTSAMVEAMYEATPFSSPGLVDGKLVSTSTDYADVKLPFVGGSGMDYYGNSGIPGGFFQYNNDKLQTDLQLKQKLDFVTKGLFFKVKGSYNSLFGVTKEGSRSMTTYTPYLRTDGTMGYRVAGQDGQLAYSEKTGKGRDWYFETSLNYNRSFGLHSIGALLLYNQSKNYYLTDDPDYTDIPRGYVGLVGRITYDWNNRYMAEFNIGHNGSENFAPGKRYGTFPAGSLGWVVSDEPFFKPVRSVVSFMKIRGSWGLVGNDKIKGSRFLYLSDPYGVNSGSQFARGGRGYNFGIENNTNYMGAYESSKNNPDVTWEKAFKQDYGVDIYFLNDRLQANMDYYKEHRKDILLSDKTAPGIIGFQTPPANLGVVDSHGWELTLKWNDKVGNDFRYWANVNLSYNQNEIKELKEKPYNNAYQYEKGHRIGARSQYLFFGFYDENTPAEYKKKYGEDFPTQLAGSSLKNGDAVYVDLDHNGKIDENDMSRDYGYTDDPRYIVGLNFGLTWKNITFSTQWTGAWDVSRSISGVFREPFVNRTGIKYGGLLQYHIDHTWNPDNPGQDYEYPRATLDNSKNNYATSTLYEKDAKYLRLKALEIAYDFHFPLMKKMGMHQLQLAFSGYNLLTFTPYLWGDPETNASSSPSYPLQKTYTLSLKVGF